MGEVEKGFGQITGHIFAVDEKNKQGLVAVYSYLCFKGGAKKYCFPAHITIAEAVGVSKSTVIRNLKKLEELGFVKRLKRKGKSNSLTSTCYILLKLVDSLDELKEIEKEIREKWEVVSPMTLPSVTHDSTLVSPMTVPSVTHDTLTITNNNNNEHNISNNDDVVADKDIEQESLSAAATAIINKLNSICNSNYRSTEVVKRYIQKLFDAGYTEQDLNLVLDIKVKEFVRDKKLAMTKPKNIFGDVSRFDELLQEANNIHLKGSNDSYKRIENKKKVINADYEENSNKSYSEATEEEKQELLQQLEELRNKEVKENG